MLLRQKQMEAILELKLDPKDELRNHYKYIFNVCFDKMIERKDTDGYGTDKDILKSLKEGDIQDLASMCKLKSIRIKNTDNPDTQEDNAIDIINYMVEILRRL